MKRLAILLIEDNVEHAELVQRSLRRAGTQYGVHWVSSMCDALAALQATQVDVVLADLSLPDSNGVETVARLREQQHDLPVIVLTSLADDAVAMAALDFGVQDYLVKDAVSPEVLNRAIRYARQRQQNLTEIKRLLSQLQTAETELKRKNRRLAKLYRTAHRFVDNVSHEFRTPLTVIKEYGSLLKEGLLGPVNEEQQRFLDVLSDRSDDLNRMVDDMLDVSKLNSGILGVSRTNCRVQDIIDHVLPGLERKASLKQINLSVNVDNDLPEIYADSDKIGRVIVNLVVNAIKFCGEPGKVCLSATAQPNSKEVEIGVSDNGAGIRQEDLKKIFRRFKQLGGVSRASTKGFGLGLSIARELVDLNLGTMHVVSEPGRGSTFSFTLSTAEPEEVVRRQLARLKRLRHGPSQVCLIAARLSSLAVPGDRDDIEALLAGVLRQDDLLFRQSDGWRMVLPCTRLEIGRFFVRVERALAETDRNRPRGPLPRLKFEELGFWDFPDQVSSLLEELTQQPLVEVLA